MTSLLFTIIPEVFPVGFSVRQCSGNAYAYVVCTLHISRIRFMPSSIRCQYACTIELGVMDITARSWVSLGPSLHIAWNRRVSLGFSLHNYSLELALSPFPGASLHNFSLELALLAHFTYTCTR